MKVSRAPIIVLGSQRSGTTEMYRALTKIMDFKGDTESHLWPAVAAAWQALDLAVAKMGGIQSTPYSNFTIGRVGLENIKARLASVLISTYEEQFGSQWIDKTPGVEMVRSVEMLAKSLPDVRFIFMKRRAIENVMSKMRRFPGASFNSACTEWADTMNAWLDVRSSVGDRAIEVDQMTMATFPEQVSQEICEFLGEGEETMSKLSLYLGETRSEQTKSHSSGRTMSMDDTNWTVKQKKAFCELCAPMMAMYGYAFAAEKLYSHLTPLSIPLTFAKAAPNVIFSSESGSTRFRPEGLTVCYLGSGETERVTIAELPTSGQNAFEAVLQSGGRNIGKRAFVVIRTRRPNLAVDEVAIEYSLGTREEIKCHFSEMDGPITLEIEVRAAKSDDDRSTFNMIHPRLTYLDHDR